MAYLLDSDWAIEALAGRGRAAATLSRIASRSVAVSIITVAEVYEGAFKSPNPPAHLNAFRLFLSAFRILGVSDPIVERFAEVRSQLRRRGTPVPDFDLLIAATALHHRLTVLTFNTRHYQRIPGLALYRPR